MRKKPRHGTVTVERSDDQLRDLLLAYVKEDDEAFEAVCNMSAYDPDQSWRFIELARDAELSDEQLAFVSAGPFEDLMKRHGAEFIELIEAAAQQDPKMRFLIGTVWREGMSDAVWQRIEALRSGLGIKQL